MKIRRLGSAGATAIAMVSAVSSIASVTTAQEPRRTWTADNGDGTFTNPLFYEEFSDPDIIRVGQDFYMTGTTNHVMPGLPILHSRDLVNWTLLSYAFDRLDLGPDLRLEKGQEAYGQGIWAPSFRYHNGTFYIFSNVNNHETQLFRAKNPAGPWTRTPMKRSLHDLGVLFDDDGAVYVVWGYREVRMARLNAALDDIVPGSERVIIKKDQGMGEGAHLYKLNGRYYITSAWFSGRMRMPMARADKPYGPYEVNHAISLDEGFGLAEGYRLSGPPRPPFKIRGPITEVGRTVMHQGGIVDTPDGKWWGFSMTDFNSLGRLTALSPVTWKDGWPYFGLPGNLGRTPRTWTKPVAGVAPVAPYQRSDQFSGPALGRIWQWNHAPDDNRWSLGARRGHLRLKTLPATNLLDARNTLTQRAVGPRSQATALLDAGGLADGDTAGLALFGIPYRWIGVRREGAGSAIVMHDQRTGETVRAPLKGRRVWLRADCDFLTEQAQLSYSLDGRSFRPLGSSFVMVFQLKTFQGIRYSLFAFNDRGRSGGHADFDRFDVDEPQPRGSTRPIPYGRTVTLRLNGEQARLAERDQGVVTARAGEKPIRFRLVDRKLGRVALRSAGGWLAGWLAVDQRRRRRLGQAGRAGSRRDVPVDGEHLRRAHADVAGDEPVPHRRPGERPGVGDQPRRPARPSGSRALARRTGRLIRTQADLFALMCGNSRARRSVNFTINDRPVEAECDVRTSLLDLFREHLHLTGSKKGCNQGACGACTVLVDGERIVSCLALAVQYEGRRITTIEGLGSEADLHPLQSAFIQHDGFQCGYCTPGQICSAIGMLAEFDRGVPSVVADDIAAAPDALTRDELRERMSGNLCRCGAYNGIVDAIASVQSERAR